MTVFEELQEASLDDFVFLVNSERNSSGKKIVAHEYPNSDKRYAEELGIIPDTFTLDAVIHGSKYQRILFEQILRKPGIKKLVHPIYGDLDVMAGAYTVSSNQTRVGEFLFSITLYSTEANVSPEIESLTRNKITADVDALQAAADAAAARLYQAPSFVDSARAAYNRAIDFCDSVADGIDTIVSPAEELRASLHTVINTARATMAAIVQTPEALFNTLSDIIETAASVAELPSSLFGMWNDLLSFGDDDTEIEETTVKRQEIVNNNKVLNDYIKVTALARLYEAAVFTDFLTDDELSTTRQELSAAYEAVVIDRITDTDLQTGDPLVLDPDVRNTIITIRNDSREIFEQLLLSVWRVTEIDWPLSSSLIATYRYYGDLDNLDVIAGLNPDKNAAGFKGALKMVS